MSAAHGVEPQRRRRRCGGRCTAASSGRSGASAPQGTEVIRFEPSAAHPRRHGPQRRWPRTAPRPWSRPPAPTPLAHATTARVDAAGSRALVAPASAPPDAHLAGVGSWTATPSTSTRRASADVRGAAGAPRHLRRRPRRFGARRPPGVAVDLGCGPGWYTAALGGRSSPSTRALADGAPHPRGRRPRALGVQADLAGAPVPPRRRSPPAGPATPTSTCAPADVPMALADLHRVARGRRAGRARRSSPARSEGRGIFPDDDFPGRWFSTWTERAPARRRPRRRLRARRARACAPPAAATAASRVRATPRPDRCPTSSAPGMRLLVCGLNPSVHAADAGVGLRHPGQPLLAGRPRGRARHARPRPAPRPPPPRHRHDRPREAGDAARRRAHPRRVPRRPRAPRSPVRLAAAGGGLLRRPGRLAGRRRPPAPAGLAGPRASAAARST